MTIHQRLAWRLSTLGGNPRISLALAILATALALTAMPAAASASDPSQAGETKESAPTQPPNILFVFCDDLTCQAVSAYGDERKLLETPNIDRLAREGMKFDRCLVTNSICGPSRASVLTGKYSHKHGFYNNMNCSFDGSQATLPKLLSPGGYTTAVIGKWHLVSDPVGFDHWQILPGQGAYYNPPMILNGKKIVEEGYVSDRITDLSIEWMKQQDKSKPFLLMTHHKAPHREWAPALRHLGWDNDRRYPEPPTLFDDFAGRSLALRDQDMSLANSFGDRDTKLTPPPNLKPAELEQWNAYYGPRNEAFRQANLEGKELVRWRYNRYMHDYLGCVKAVDESLGRLLAYLDEAGLADNTIVVLTSDQGFFLGEHGWYDKRWILEESLRSPLLVRWPGVTKPGSSTNEIVSLIDIAPTFLEAAGLPIPDEMQGTSFAALCRGEQPADWRKSLYYHYYEFPVYHRVRPHYGLITDRYKLVHYYMPDVDDWELIDREKDPLEVKNFYNHPDYADVILELHAELERQRGEMDDLAPAPREAYGRHRFDNEPQPAPE